jgi:hypothetical protein
MAPTHPSRIDRYLPLIHETLEKFPILTARQSLSAVSPSVRTSVRATVASDGRRMLMCSERCRHTGSTGPTPRRLGTSLAARSAFGMSSLWLIDVMAPTDV